MSEAGKTPESPPVVVLVDDEVDLLDLLRQYLSGEGYQVHCASGGKAGIRSVLQLQPDAVVTDLMMPEVSGLDVLEASQLRHPDVSVLILTGYASLESSIDALDLGAVGYMLKPIKRGEFASRVRDAIQQTRLRRERTALMLDFATASLKLQAVFDAVVQGLILVSADGMVESVNPAAAKLLGRPAEEVAGKAFEDVLARDSAELAKAITRVQETREPEILKDSVLATEREAPAMFNATIGPVDTLEGPSGVLVTLTEVSGIKGRPRQA